MIELKRALMRLFVIFFLIRRHFPGCVRLSFQRMAPGRLDQSADEDFGVGGPFKPGAGNFLYKIRPLRKAKHYADNKSLLRAIFWQLSLSILHSHLKKTFKHISITLG